MCGQGRSQYGLQIDSERWVLHNELSAKHSDDLTQ